MTIAPYRAYDVFAPTDGSGNARGPEMFQAQQWGMIVEAVANFGLVWRTTKTNLDAVTPTSGTYPGGAVTADSTSANNGFYIWTGSAWSRTRGFPDTAAVLENIGGTANAITADTATGVDPAEIKLLILPDPPGTNTSTTVTITLNSGSAENIKSASGGSVAIGDIISGIGTMFFRSGSEWRQLFSSQTGATMDFQGTWSSATVYTRAQFVTLSGVLYFLDAASSVNESPASGSPWLAVFDMAQILIDQGALVDSDFASPGIMATDGAGTYSIITNNSSNWNTAYGWGDHSAAGYAELIGATFTGSVVVSTGNIVSEAADASSNSHFWMDDNTGTARAVGYWDYANDYYTLKNYNNGAGNGASISLSTTGIILSAIPTYSSQPLALRTFAGGGTQTFQNTSPTNEDGGADFQFYRDTYTGSITGGTVGYVNATAKAYTKVASAQTSYEWGILTVLDNYAAAGENTASYNQATKYGQGQTWAGVDEVREVTTATYGALVGRETALSCNGTDASNIRIAHDVIGARYDDTATIPEIYAGVRITAGWNGSGAGVESAKFKNGLLIDAYWTTAALYLNNKYGIDATSGTSVHLLKSTLSDGGNIDGLSAFHYKTASASGWSNTDLILERTVDGSATGQIKFAGDNSIVFYTTSYNFTAKNNGVWNMPALTADPSTLVEGDMWLIASGGTYQIRAYLGGAIRYFTPV